MAGSATAGVGDPIPAGASGPGITGEAPASGDGGGPVRNGDLPISPPSFNLAHPFTEGNYYNNCQWHEPTQSGGVGQ